jgi:hypothetical protein
VDLTLHGFPVGGRVDGVGISKILEDQLTAVIPRCAPPLRPPTHLAFAVDPDLQLFIHHEG